VKKTIVAWVVLISALVIVAVELFPITVIIFNGFKRDIDIWSKNPFYFKPTLMSYKNIFSNQDFVRSLKSSMIVASLSTIVSVIFGAMASYGLVRFNFKVNTLIVFILLMLRMVPQMTLALPFYVLFRTFNMNDNVFGLSLAHISFNLPYVVALLLPFFASIPKEFEEAAKVDGCTSMGIFWRIFLPLASAGIVVATVFAFLMSWNEFIYALVLTGSRAKTAPVAVNAFLGQYAPLWGQLSAAGTIMLLPVFAITLGLQRYIIKGLSAGGIKG